MSKTILRLPVLMLLALLAGCADNSDDGFSLREAMERAMNEPLYGPPSPYPGAYAPPPAVTPIGVTQVTIYGGQVRVKTGGGLSGAQGWRDLAGPIAIGLQECQPVEVPLQRADKEGGTTIYLVRVAGAVYASQYPTSGCQVPPNGQAFPLYGRHQLQIKDYVAGAVIQMGTPIGAPGPTGSYPPPGYR